MVSSTPEFGAGDHKLSVHRRREQTEAGKLLSELARNKGALAGFITLVLFVLFALVGPEVIPFDPYKTNLAIRLEPPDAVHWMGTDELGRDLMVRIALGARYSLLIGLSASALAAVTGTVLGLVGGYREGMIGSVIMRSMDVLLAFPGVLLAITIVAVLGTGLTNVVIAIAVHSVPAYARLAYGSTLSIKQEEYVTAARTIGAGTIRLLGQHILPNIISTLIVQFSLRVATVILLAAGLGYLGLGATPPTPEWGTMLSDARAYLRTSPHSSIFPGVAIFLLVLALNLFGDGLRDALDPRLRRR